MSVTTVTNVQIDGGTWHHVFQGQNAAWLFEQREISGNFFLGLQGQTSNVFQANIPRGAIIENAFMTVNAFSTNATPYTTFLNAPDRDDGSFLRRPLINPTLPFQGWRLEQWGNGAVHVRDTGLATIVDTIGGAITGGWQMRQLDAVGNGPLGSTWRDRLAQGFTPPVNATLGQIDLTMQRFNNPIGNLRVEIMNGVSDGGVIVPDETVIATSDLVSLTTIPTTPGVVAVPFSGADQIALTGGTEYFAVIRPDVYAANNIDNVALRYRNAFLTTGRLFHYGTDQDSVWQNFPGIVDLNQAMVVAPQVLGTPVTWNVQNFVAGFNYNTPDISPVIQAQVNAESYKGSDESVIVTTSGNAGAANRVWCSSSHATPSRRPTLTVTWRRRRRGVH